MKNKILILIGSLIIVILGGLNIFQYMKKDNEVKLINNTYDCTKASDQNSGSAPGTDHAIMTYDDLGIILTLTYVSEYKYENKEEYNNVVKFYKEYGNNKYEYDDKNYIIKSINESEIKSKDEQGNRVESWIKTYVDNYKEQGYVCTKK